MASKKEKQLLKNIVDVLTEIPGAHTGMGTKTAMIGGYISYHRDMKEVIPYVCTILKSMVYDTEILWCDEEDKKEDIKNSIEEMNEYINGRKAENWR